MGIWFKYDLGPLKCQLCVKNSWDGFWWCKNSGQSGQCKSAPHKTWKSMMGSNTVSGKTKEKNEGMLMLPLGSMDVCFIYLIYMNTRKFKTLDIQSPFRIGVKETPKSRTRQVFGCLGLSTLPKSIAFNHFPPWIGQANIDSFRVCSLCSRLSDAYLESSWWVDGGLVLGLGSWEKLFDFNWTRWPPYVLLVINGVMVPL